MRAVTRPPGMACCADTRLDAALTLAPAAIAAALLAAFGVYVSWTPVLLALLGASFMSVVMTPLLANDPVWNGRVLVCGVLPFSFAVAVPLTDALGVALGYSLW